MKTIAVPSLYCNSLVSYSRFLTREVPIGNLIIGGNNPIRVQSMTTTDTMDTKATVEQSIRMIKAGCELVRITAPSINDARNLGEIKKELRKRGFDVPLIADIHFTPNAAEVAARLVEKVRVNPGNYADKKKFEHIEYDDAAYQAELERIHTRFSPLVKICMEHGTAMRIGTNHGSLSDRILSRYGDTPVGMVESAMEFLRICEDHGYHNIVLSMKSSNPLVMVQAYRLLVMKMKEEDMNYPLHLGVTEAGDGEDGRIKSASGIGTLLEDGLGDTIRVSLTEEPEYEIPVALALVRRYDRRAQTQKPIPELTAGYPENWSPVSYQKRESRGVQNIGGKQVPVVVANLSSLKELQPDSFLSLGYSYDAITDKWNLADQACDYIYCGSNVPGFSLPGTLGIILDASNWNNTLENAYPLFQASGFARPVSDKLNFISTTLNELNGLFEKLDGTCVLVLETDNPHGMAEMRRALFELINRNINTPVIFRRSFSKQDDESLSVNAAADISGLFLDGFGDGIWIDAESTSPSKINSLSFGILQSVRQRISKTEYISCPSCGRTLFDLQETTAKIRARTAHLKGVKIGIMGCIVNGPGEMADADYGYVGTGVGKITLYKGREVVQRNIDSAAAVDALIELIRKHGDWKEPS